MSDNVAVMNRAGSSRSARRRSSTTQPATAFVAGFVGDSNRWGGRVARAEAGRGPGRAAGGGSVSRRAGGAMAAGDAVRGLRPAGGDRLQRQPGRSQRHRRRVDGQLFNGAASRILVRGPGDALIEVGDA